MTVVLSRLLQKDAALPKDGDIAVEGITSDSRAVKPGFIFAALPGTKVDGGAYVMQAFANGAVLRFVKLVPTMVSKLSLKQKIRTGFWL